MKITSAAPMRIVLDDTVAADRDLLIETPHGKISISVTSLRVFITSQVPVKKLDIVTDGVHLNQVSWK